MDVGRGVHALELTAFVHHAAHGEGFSKGHAVVGLCEIGIADGADPQFFPMAFTMLPAIFICRPFRWVGVDDRQH